jgi:hypothetical protein
MSPSLSICVPSHRSLAESQTSIDSILGYARQKGIEVVISDNSEDSAKEAYISALNYERLLYKKGPEDESENWWNAASAATGEFIACISDDDHLFYVPGEIPPVPMGCMGLRPSVALWTPKAGFKGFTSFSILEESPTERIKHYLKVNGGANSTLFSFWRSDQFMKTMQLLRQHPTRLGYHDWAVVLSLLAIGPLQTLKDSMLVYNLTNWDTAQASQQTLQRMFTRGGFDPNDGRYVPFFLGVDAFILIMRHDNGIESTKKREAALFCLTSYLSSYKKMVESGKGGFKDRDLAFVASLGGTIQLQDLFLRVLDYVEQLKPGLAESYKNFWQASIDQEWGMF